MKRDFFDPNDKRNFSSLTKEARELSKDDANALRDYYETKGVMSILIPIAVGRLIGFGIDLIMKKETKIEKIIRQGGVVRNGR